MKNLRTCNVPKKSTLYGTENVAYVTNAAFNAVTNITLNTRLFFPSSKFGYILVFLTIQFHDNGYYEGTDEDDVTIMAKLTNSCNSSRCLE